MPRPPKLGTILWYGGTPAEVWDELYIRNMSQIFTEKKIQKQLMFWNKNKKYIY